MGKIPERLTKCVKYVVWENLVYSEMEGWHVPSFYDDESEKAE
jgi:hypothetical protein